MPYLKDLPSLMYNHEMIRHLFASPSYEANIPRFLVSRALYNAMFFLPIWVIFVQAKHGIDLVQVTLLDSAFWLTMALTEIPTGAAADTLGRKHSYAIGTAFSAAGLLLFALAPTYPLLLVGNSLWAVALTFISGADMAFFYDSLRELGKTDAYPRYRSIVAVVDIAATGASALVGGLLYRLSPESPFLLYFVMLVLLFFLILTFREPPMETDAGSDGAPNFLDVLKTAGLALRERAGLRNVLLYSNLLPLIGAAIGVTLIQPHVVNIGLPVEALGVVLLGINLARVIGAGAAAPLAGKFGEWRLLSLAPLLVVAGVLGIGFFSHIGGLLLFTLTVFAASAARPTIEDIMMKETPGKVRATILSLDSLIFRLMLAGVNPFAGIVAEAYSLPTAFILLGLSAGAFLGLNLVFWSRSRPRTVLSPIGNEQSLD